MRPWHSMSDMSDLEALSNSMPQHSNPETIMERTEKQQAEMRTWSALSTTKRARSASCCATCFASTALVNCRGNNSRRSDSTALPFKLS